MVYGSPVILKVEGYDRFLTGSRGHENRGVHTRDFRTEDPSKLSTYEWTMWSQSGSRQGDPEAGQCVKFGDVVYLRNGYRTDRWLSSSRGHGNNGVDTRFPFSSSEVSIFKRGFYSYTVRSALGSFYSFYSSADPLDGECVTEQMDFFLQGGGISDRWLTGARGHGNTGVFTRDPFGAYELTVPFTYQWSAINVNQPVLPPPPPPAPLEAIFYSEKSFSGSSLALGVGEYNYRLLSDKHFDDRISSVKVPVGLEVLMCSDPDFRGHCETFTGSVDHVVVGDGASSLKVYATKSTSAEP